jgi:hypothetical protein
MIYWTTVLRDFFIDPTVSQLLDTCILFIGRGVVLSIGMGATAWVAPLTSGCWAPAQP